MREADVFQIVFFFFSLTVNEARPSFLFIYLFFLLSFGGEDVFTFLYLKSFLVTRCEVGRDAQREACRQLLLMFGNRHI